MRRGAGGLQEVCDGRRGADCTPFRRTVAQGTGPEPCFGLWQQPFPTGKGASSPPSPAGREDHEGRCGREAEGGEAGGPANPASKGREGAVPCPSGAAEICLVIVPVLEYRDTWGSSFCAVVHCVYFKSK